MEKRLGTTPEFGGLRRRAEDVIRDSGQAPVLESDNARKLLYELQVREIELEMQNEELRTSQAETEASMERLAEFFDYAPTSYLTVQRDGIISEINLTGASLIGLDRQSLIGRRLGFYVAPDHRPAYVKFLTDVFAGLGKQTCEVLLHTADLRSVFVHIEAIADGAAKRCRMTLADITKRKQMEDALHESEVFFRTITENAGDLIAMLDADGKMIYYSPSYLQLFEKDEMAAGASSFNEIHPDDRERVKEVFRRTVATGTGERCEYRLQLKDGSVRHIESQGSAVLNAEGAVSKVIVVSRDVTAQKCIEQQLRHLSYHDALTGLPNRILLSDRLQHAIAAARRDTTHKLSLMFIDLDEFKPVNDRLGHSVGDLLLKEVAGRIQDCLRESDTAARIGGDEFAVLLSTTDAQHAPLLVAEKIRHALCQPFDLDGHELRISSSIGIAVYPEDGDHEEALFKHADGAMYQAKKSGRNTVRFHATGRQ